MSFIYVIYKRFKRLGISNVLVAAGVIADGSVDQALKEKHFKCRIRCLQLFYETLLQHALDKHLDGAPLSHEIKASLAILRKQNIADKNKLIEAYDKQWNNAELKMLVDTLFKDYLNAPQAEHYMSFMEMS